MKTLFHEFGHGLQVRVRVRVRARARASVRVRVRVRVRVNGWIFGSERTLRLPKASQRA